MALKKLPKNKPDIKFINHETMKVECTYNGCFQKFEEEWRYSIKTPVWFDYHPQKHKTYFHRCSECGRTYASNKDHSKSIEHYDSEKSILPKEGSDWSIETVEEIQELLKQYHLILEKAKNPDILKKITKRIDEWELRLKGALVKKELEQKSGT